MHAFECSCQPIGEWIQDPYGPLTIQQAFFVACQRATKVKKGGITKKFATAKLRDIQENLFGVNDRRGHVEPGMEVWFIGLLEKFLTTKMGAMKRKLLWSTLAKHFVCPTLN